MNQVSSELEPIQESQGAWLMVSLAEKCTLIEYFTWSDPGGFVGVAQWLFAKGTIRNTLIGLTRMANAHISEPHPGATFYHADGSRFD